MEIHGRDLALDFGTATKALCGVEELKKASPVEFEAECKDSVVILKFASKIDLAKFYSDHGCRATFDRVEAKEEQMAVRISHLVGFPYCLLKKLTIGVEIKIQDSYYYPVFYADGPNPSKPITFVRSDFVNSIVSGLDAMVVEGI